MNSKTTLTIRRPDDWHVHLRDGEVLKSVVNFTAAHFGRAIVMPNLVPPVTTAKQAVAYRERILAAVEGHRFTPLMTCYLTDDTDKTDLIAGFRDGIFTAVKLYPAHATTNSAHGVTDLDKVRPVLEAMAEAGMRLLVHGEVPKPEIDVFDREKVFIDTILLPLLDKVPALKIVMEHVTTLHGVAVVRAHRSRLGATITPHGTPAALSASIALSRRCGALARGSSVEARRLSSEVTETKTCTRLSRASGASRSRSRSTKAFLVMIVNGCRCSPSTSMIERVMR